MNSSSINKADILREYTILTKINYIILSHNGCHSFIHEANVIFCYFLLKFRSSSTYLFINQGPLKNRHCLSFLGTLPQGCSLVTKTRYIHSLFSRQIQRREQVRLESCNMLYSHNVWVEVNGTIYLFPVNISHLVLSFDPEVSENVNKWTDRRS